MSKFLPLNDLEHNHTFSSTESTKNLGMKDKGPRRETIQALLEFSRTTQFLNSNILNEGIEWSEN